MFEKKKQILKNALKFKDIKTLDKKTFLKAWKAIFFISPFLHPDEYQNPDGGWPKKLKPLAKEAFRRAQKGEFTENEIYPYSEVLKSIKVRRMQQK